MSRQKPSTPLNILLIEDNIADVTLTREAIRESGLLHTFHVAGDGEEALRFLRREGGYAGAERPHLILLDLNMPRKDGRDVMREIRADPDPQLRITPVIVLTTSASEADVCLLYRLGANCYVTKPSTLSEYFETLADIAGLWAMRARIPHNC